MSNTAAGAARAAELSGLRPYLVRVAQSRIGDRETAEDLVQDTLATAWGSVERFEGRSTLRTWVTGILLHKVMDAFRAIARRSALHRDVPEHQEDPDFDSEGTWRAPVQAWSDPELALDCKRFEQELRNQISRLPDLQSRAYRLRELEGRETAEVCAELGVTEGNLFVLLHRARLGLRRSLDREWFQARR
jgi:RNA polymerase sigma-70 factor (TIGR02943 family)